MPAYTGGGVGNDVPKLSGTKSNKKSVSKRDLRCTHIPYTGEVCVGNRVRKGASEQDHQRECNDSWAAKDEYFRSFEGVSFMSHDDTSLQFDKRDILRTVTPWKRFYKSSKPEIAHTGRSGKISSNNPTAKIPRNNPNVSCATSRTCIHH